MKRTAWLISLTVALLLAGPVLAENDGNAKEVKAKKVKKEKKVKGCGRFNKMDKVVSFTDEQKEKIGEALAAEKESLAEWNKQNGEKLKSLREEWKAAKEAKDKDKLKSTGKEMAELYKQRRAITKATDDQVMNLLTDEQKEKWNKYQEELKAERKAKMEARKAKMAEKKAKEEAKKAEKGE